MTEEMNAMEEAWPRGKSVAGKGALAARSSSFPGELGRNSETARSTSQQLPIQTSCLGMVPGMLRLQNLSARMFCQAILCRAKATQCHAQQVLLLAIASGTRTLLNIVTCTQHLQSAVGNGLSCISLTSSHMLRLP